MTEAHDPMFDRANIPEQNSVEEILRDTFELLEIEGGKLIGSLEPALEDEFFRNNLDSVENHQPSWHQWGIITHTLNVLKMLKTEAADLIVEWGIKEKLNEYMGKKIDPLGNYTKWELLMMSIPPHDLGKFASKMSDKNLGVRDHGGHERISGEMVADTSGAFWKYYSLKGLTGTEIKYIARLAGKHFELGKIRLKATRSAAGYSIAYATGNDFLTDARNILEEDREILVELGIWFLIDSMGKTDLVIEAETDQQIENKREEASGLVQQKMKTGEVKDARLVQAVLQRPVNIAMAKRLLIDSLV